MKTNINSVSFCVETEIYPLEAVFAAANVFLAKAFVRIGTEKKGLVTVELRPRLEAGGRPPVLEGEFCNELLHHALRLKVSERNQVLREKIVAQALVSASAPAAGTGAAQAAGKGLDAELEKEINKLLKEAESGSYKNDHLGIAIPWEKKHGKKNAK